MISADAILNKLKRDKRKNSIGERRGLRPTQWVTMYGFSKCCIAKGNKEIVEEVERSNWDHRSVSVGTFEQIKHGSNRAQFEIIKHHNSSLEDWCIPSDMEKVGYLLMDPACKVNEKGTRGKTMKIRL